MGLAKTGCSQVCFNIVELCLTTLVPFERPDHFHEFREWSTPSEQAGYKHMSISITTTKPSELLYAH